MCDLIPIGVYIIEALLCHWDSCVLWKKQQQLVE